MVWLFSLVMVVSSGTMGNSDFNFVTGIISLAVQLNVIYYVMLWRKFITFLDHLGRIRPPDQTSI